MTPLTMLVSLSLPFLNLYLFVWYHTPAVVQRQKGPCLIHTAHGRCACAWYTTVITQRLLYFCVIHLPSVGSTTITILIVWYQTPAVVQHQKGRCLIHRAHGRCTCASYTTTTTAKPKNCCIFVSFIDLRLDQHPLLY